jgi:lipopolysaccharide biosynthesis glycosyltransferase
VSQQDNVTMHVAYGASPEYSKYIPVAMFSLLSNNSAAVSFHIFSYSEYKDQQKDKILKVADHFGAEVIFYVIDEYIVHDANLPTFGWDDNGHNWGAPKLLYQRYLPDNLDRVLHLGLDCIVLDDFPEFEEDEKIAFAVCDKEYVRDRNIGVDVLLINLNQFRQENIDLFDMCVEKYNERRAELNKNSFSLENFFINCFFDDRILRVDQKYDRGFILPKHVEKVANDIANLPKSERPVIVQGNGPANPWTIWNALPLGKIWLFVKLSG